MIGAIPERILTDDEIVLEEFHPHWRILIPSIAAAVLAVLATAVIAGADGVWVTPLLAAIWVGVAALFAVELVKRVSTTYSLSSHRLIWRWGILRRQGMETPLEQINTVQFSQNIIERALGFGDLEIESASQGGTTKLTDIPDPQAFQARVYTARNNRTHHLHGSQRQHSAPTGPTPIEQLSRLAEMHAAGQLTDTEFTHAKAQLLGLPVTQPGTDREGWGQADAGL